LCFNPAWRDGESKFDFVKIFKKIYCIMIKTEKNKFKYKVLGLIVVISSLILFTAPADGAVTNYYYLQVASSKTTTRALSVSKKLSDINEHALVRGEDVPKKGYWYRVYLGPSSSFQEASQKRLDLRKKGFNAKGAFVHKKKSLIQSNLALADQAKDKSIPITPEKEAVKGSPPEKKPEQLSMQKHPPATVHGGQTYYYYLQVGSFKTDARALSFDQKLHSVDESAIIRGEEISDLGYWYRVYLGPFSSFQKASQKRLDLRKKGFYAERSFVHKKANPIQSNLQETKEKADEKMVIAVEQETVKPGPPIEAAAPAAVLMAEVPPAEEKLLAETPPASLQSETEELSEITKTAPAPVLEGYSEDIEPPTRDEMHIGKGRNITQGTIAIDLKQAYVNTNTELTSRKVVSTTGGTTTTQNVPLSSLNTTDYPTDMHMTTARIRFALTDFIEVFGDIGTAYDDFSDFEPVYGGGLRLNIFEIPVRNWGRWYLALQGEYLDGKVNSEYSDGGSNWEKEADWEEFTGKVELGISGSEITAYLGGVYFEYSEDTERRLLNNLPAGATSYIIKDELEEEYNYGIYGGGTFHFTPAVQMNLEGQLINQEAISISILFLF
jgi:cell division protein FtsN